MRRPVRAASPRNGDSANSYPALSSRDALGRSLAGRNSFSSRAARLLGRGVWSRLPLFPLLESASGQPLTSDPPGHIALIPLSGPSPKFHTYDNRPTPLWAWLGLIVVLAGLWYEVWRPMLLTPPSLTPSDLTAPMIEPTLSRTATSLWGGLLGLKPNIPLVNGGNHRSTIEPWFPVVAVDGRMVRLKDQELSLEGALKATGHALGNGDRVFLIDGLGKRVAALPADMKLQHAVGMSANWPITAFSSHQDPRNDSIKMPPTISRANLAVQRAVSFSFMDGGLQTILSAAANTVGEGLRINGVVIHPEDLLTPDQMRPLSPGIGIRLLRAKPVRIRGKDFVFSARTHAPTVEKVLTEANVNLGPLDLVEPSLTMPVTESTEIRVTRVHVDRQRQNEVVPFDYRQVQDPNLPSGLRRRVQHGSPGAITRLVETRFEDGQIVASKVIAEQTLIKPRADVIAYGVLSLPGALADLAVVSRLVPGYNRLTSDSLAVRKVMSVEATGYEAGFQSTGKWPDNPWYGITSIGWQAVPGVIAVDPRVIPYGTRLYVPGYGFGIAADTGGAIVGDRIDLFYETVSEAMHWGRRIVPAYILE